MKKKRIQLYIHLILIHIQWILCVSLACELGEFQGQIGIFASECTFWVYSGYIGAVAGEQSQVSVSFERFEVATVEILSALSCSFEIISLNRDCRTNYPLRTIFNDGMQSDESILSGPQPPAIGNVGSKTILQITGCNSQVHDVQQRNHKAHALTRNRRR